MKTIEDRTCEQSLIYSNFKKDCKLNADATFIEDETYFVMTSMPFLVEGTLKFSSKCLNYFYSLLVFTYHWSPNLQNLFHCLLVMVELQDRFSQ